MQPNFKIYFKVMIIKMVWFWQKSRHRDQWNVTQSLETDSHIYGQFIFEKVAKATLWRED